MEHTLSIDCTLTLARQLVAARIACKSDVLQIVAPSGRQRTVLVVAVQRHSDPAKRHGLLMQLIEELVGSGIFDEADFLEAAKDGKQVRVH